MKEAGSVFDNVQRTSYDYMKLLDKTYKDGYKFLIVDDKDDNSNLFPYYVRMNGINKYSYNSKPHEMFQRFNPLHYTLNPNDIIFPYSFLVLSGYKTTIFSLDKNK